MSKYYFNKKDELRIQRAETNLLTFVSTIMGSKRYKENYDDKSSDIIKRISETVLLLNGLLIEISVNNQMYVPKDWEQIDKNGNIIVDKELRSEYI